MKDSTRRISRMLGLENAEQTVHLYLYTKYIDHYIYNMAKPVGLVDKEPSTEIPPELEDIVQILALKVAREALSAETSTYHGKVLPLKNAVELVRVEEDIELRNLERIIPYRVARDIVLENPQSIAALNCPCRSLHQNPCEPLDVCLIVGEPFASFVVEHGVMGARKVTVDETVEILEAEHRRGHVHSAFFKDVTGGRYYAICNCCSCCCLGVQSWNASRIPILAPSGYVAVVSEECTGCGECAEACPFDAVTAGETALVDVEKCMGCGVCEGACYYGAVSLKEEPSKGEPLDIRKLLEKGADREGV